MSTRPESFLATSPFHVTAHGFVDTADHDRVLVCANDSDCPYLYAESKINADAWFMCPNCGRLGQRMEEATPQRCGLMILPPPEATYRVPADRFPPMRIAREENTLT